MLASRSLSLAPFFLRPGGYCRLRVPVVASVLGLACSNDPPAPTGLDRPVDVRGFVVDAAAARLDSNGFFVLGVPTSPKIITPQRAAEIALIAARTYGPTDRTYLEGQVAAPIDFSALEVGPRAFFAESPYEQNLPADLHPAFHKRYGPYYLVPLNVQGRPVLSIAVSAYNTDAQIVNGVLSFSVRHGDDFRIQGINQRWGTPVPVSPEHATRLAAELTGARVSAVPELILPGRGFVAQYARWRVQLDKDVALRGKQSGAIYAGREFYVGLKGEIAAPLKSQPTGEQAIDPDTQASIDIRRRPSVPLLFEPVDR